eukprot:CAMPEP_0201595794 /NCGR_PEP_ID=MMETSP0190_2-20130828/192675_1 /ASSEMBLY_ACC=CAM_ASM_000263 /TAXON_ID=37353 /ORGANISM="Rosalina sp." /LENGTH=490 /DNA_ID=CAMNT_0048055893 /DNA_START=88 /DNA_END=1563 /DNA_ORIENTATION=-
MPSNYNNRNHNHNHNYHGNNQTCSSFNQMSNFDVLPSKAPSTPTSSSSTTPGPPPFNIIKTPLFDARAYDYSIHPDTLRHMNKDANCFDTDYSREGAKEGYDVWTTNTLKKDNNKPIYSHRTTVTTIMQQTSTSTINTPTQTNQNLNMNPYNKPSPSLLDGEMTVKPQPRLKQYSPSPAIGRSTNTTSTRRTQRKPLSGPQIQHRIHRRTPSSPIMPQISFTPSNHPMTTALSGDYIDNTCSSLNRYGINTLSVILLIVAVVAIYQYQVFNAIRGMTDIPIIIDYINTNTNTNSNTTEPNIPYDFEKWEKMMKTIEYMEKANIDLASLKKQVEENKKYIEENTAAPIDDIENVKTRVQELESKLDESSGLDQTVLDLKGQVAKNTQDIRKNNDSLTEVKEDTLPILEKKTKDIEDAVGTKMNVDDILEQRAWYNAHNVVNYISGIHRKPNIIPFVVIDNDNNKKENEANSNDNDNDNNNNKGFVDTVKKY